MGTVGPAEHPGLRDEAQNHPRQGAEAGSSDFGRRGGLPRGQHLGQRAGDRRGAFIAGGQRLVPRTQDHYVAGQGDSESLREALPEGGDHRPHHRGRVRIPQSRFRTLQLHGAHTRDRPSAADRHVSGQAAHQGPRSRRSDRPSEAATTPRCSTRARPCRTSSRPTRRSAARSKRSKNSCSPVRANIP